MNLRIFFISLITSIHVLPFANATQPNIIIILADDMGYSDIGCYGSEIETPALDKLAAQGLRFRYFYNTSRCSTSRAALLTGLYPWQTGIGRLDKNLGAPGYKGFLNDQCVTIAEVLGSVGYHTSISGKWHLGKKRPNWPIDRGFERQFTSPSGGGYYYRPVQPQIGDRTMYLDETAMSESELVNWDGDPDAFYSTDDFTDAAIMFIDQAISQNKPFFVYLPFIAPHWPLEAPEADVEKYISSGLYDEGWSPIRKARLAKQKGQGGDSDNLIGIAETLNGTDEEWELSPEPVKWVEGTDSAKIMSIHAAVIDRMDQNIARLIEHLESVQGVLDDTIIIFLSDNGASDNGGDFGSGTLGNPIGGPTSIDIEYGEGWANASDTPFRGYKKDTENGGIITPFIIHWPNGISRSGGSVVTKRAHLIDIMPTLLDAAGASYPAVFKNNAIIPLAGESFADLFSPGGSELRSSPMYFSHEARSGIISGDWKGVSHDDPLNKPFQLYDLSKDPSELNDLSSSNPSIQNSLKESWFAWAHRSNVKDWPIRSLPSISVDPVATTITQFETADITLSRDAASGSSEVFLDYSGDVRLDHDIKQLPSSVALSGSSGSEITITPITDSKATGPVEVEVQVKPNFWYIEPDATSTITINRTSLND